MSKVDLLRQASEGTFADLYVDNKPKEKEITQTILQPQDNVVNIETKQEVVVKDKKQVNKMLSFRLPLDLIDKLDKYSYVAREKKQDVIIKAFDKFLNSKDAKELIAEYESIKECK